MNDQRNFKPQWKGNFPFFTFFLCILRHLGLLIISTYMHVLMVSTDIDVLSMTWRTRSRKDTSESPTKPQRAITQGKKNKMICIFNQNQFIGFKRYRLVHGTASLVSSTFTTNVQPFFQTGLETNWSNHSYAHILNSHWKTQLTETIFTSHSLEEVQSCHLPPKGFPNGLFWVLNPPDTLWNFKCFISHPLWRFRTHNHVQKTLRTPKVKKALQLINLAFSKPVR